MFDVVIDQMLFAWAIIFLGGGLFLALLLWLVLTRRDLRQLQHAVHQLSRSLALDEPLPSRLSFFSGLVSDIWKSLVLFSARQRHLDRAKPAFEEVLAAGTRITAASDEITMLSKEIGDVILEQTQPDALAVAIVLRNPETEVLQVQYLRGIPGKRIDGALLMYFDQLLENQNKNSEAKWGYRTAQSDDLHDFSTFGIGTTLAIPLYHVSEKSTVKNGAVVNGSPISTICGGIWLGFKREAVLLSSPRKSFVQSVAQHGAASFAAAAKMQLKTRKSAQERDFLLGISHDLRAPGSSALYALSDLISGELGSLNEKQQLCLVTVQQALQDQMEILGDVLDLAKHQRGLLEAKQTIFLLEPVVRKVVNRFEVFAVKKGLQLVLETPPSITVKMDCLHLERILANLLCNAIKYTPFGKVTVSFLFIDHSVEIRVSDSGPGISQEERALLFREFKQFGSSASQQVSQQGFGLGLALSKALAELNGAQVFYEEQQKGGGSIFGVSVPSYGTEEATIEICPAQARACSAQFDRVLVVDDDGAACRTNIRYLKELSRSSIPASTLDEAYQLAKQLLPDLVVTDLNLPDGSGLSLLEKLEAEAIQAPAIIITGCGYATQILATRKCASPIAVIEKPVTRETLLTAVKSLAHSTIPQ